MAKWEEIKKQRMQSGTNSGNVSGNDSLSTWEKEKIRRGMAKTPVSKDTNPDSVIRMDFNNAEIIDFNKDKPKTTSVSPISVDPKIVEQAKLDRFKTPDITGDPDLEKYANIGAEKTTFKIGDMTVTSNITKFGRYYNALTDEEKKIYNYWIGKGNKENAKKYLNSVIPSVNARNAQKEAEIATDITKKSKLAGAAYDVVSSFAAPMGIVDAVSKSASGEDIDLNSPMYAGVRAQNNVEKELFKDATPLEQFFGQTALSTAKFAVTLPFGSVGALSIMSSGAAGNAAYDATSRGASTEEAMLLGLTTGITEYLTEKLPVDNLFRLAKSNVNLISKAGVKQILKQAGIEGTEEVVSQYANTLTDMVVMGNRSNYAIMKAELIAQGVPEDQAESMALKNTFITQPALAFAGGALSGGLLGAGAAGVATYHMNQTGSKMRGLGIEQDIIDTGLESDQTSQSYKQAARVADIMKNGGKVSNADLGSLYYANVEAINGENDEAQRKGIRAMLVDNGVTESEAEKISSVMQRAFSGDPLSNNDAEAIIKNDSARELFSQMTGISIPLSTMSEMRKSVKQFSEDVVTGKSQAIYIEPQISSEKVETAAQGIKTPENPVPSSANENPGQAAPIKKVYSREEVKQAVSKFGKSGQKAFGINYKDREDLEDYSRAFSAYYIAGRTGLPMDQVDKSYGKQAGILSSDVRYSAYSAGQNDAKSENTAQAAASIKSFDKKESGIKDTKEIDSHVAKAMDIMGKITGTKINMVDSIEVGGRKGAANGFYKNGELQIAKDAENPYIVVAKHEVTHRLKEVSPEAYNEYKNYVVNVMTQNGTLEKNVKRLDNLYRRSGQNLTYDEILDEIAANFTEQIMTDPDAFSDLVVTNRSTAQKILDYLKEFIQKLMAAFDKTDSNLRNRLGFNIDELQKAEAMWTAALKASDISTNSEATELSDAETKYSIRESDPPKKTMIGYKVFVAKNGKLYPPMAMHTVATPVGVWLDAEVAPTAKNEDGTDKLTKTGRKQMQSKGGTLAFRPGWHLGEFPIAPQFYEIDKTTGEKVQHPDFVWAECEFAADIDYQDEAMSYGYTKKGKFQHSLAGLPKIPEEGYYKYRTNPNPDTIPWFISGAMKVNRVLSDAETDRILKENNITPMKRAGGAIDLKKYGLGAKEARLSLKDAFIPEYIENREKALKEFGTTNHFNEAGFMLPDGKLLDFSGKKEHGLPGVRWMDHREIQSIYDDISHTDAMNKFISEGNIRMMPESPAIDLSANIKPTTEQFNTIKQFITRITRNDYFAVDFSADNGSSVANLEYDGKINANKIVSDIKYYFDNGEVPRQSELDKFRFSLKDSEGSPLIGNQAQYFTDSKVRNEEGNLLAVYHGSRDDFHEFKYSSDIGYHFGTEEQASNIANLKGEGNGVVKRYYLNITNPVYTHDAYAWYMLKPTLKALEVSGAITEAESKKLLYMTNWNPDKRVKYHKTESEVLRKEIPNLLKSKGFDGIIYDNAVEKEGEGKSFIIFDSEQAKLANNINPTTSKDIRYSLKDEAVEIPTSEVDYQTDDVRRGVENDQGRVDAFKGILKTGKDHFMFEAKDIKAPIFVVKENGRYVAYDGNHRLMAYKQLGYDKIPAYVYDSYADYREGYKRIELNSQMETEGNSFYDEQNDAVYTRYSLKSFQESDRRATYEMLIKAGNTPAEAMRKMSQLYGIARLIMADKMLYDFEPNRDYSAYKENSDYGFSMDASANCKKRLVFQSTMEEILKRIKDRPFVSNDYMLLRAMLKDRNYEVGCGICFVDGQRMKLGEMAQEFFEKYPEMKKKYSYYDLMSEEGQTRFKKEDPDMFSTFIRLRGSQGRPKPFEPRTDYRGELIKKYQGKPNLVNTFNEHGGFRLLSSSDFELVHMLDFMQVITDAEIVGFKGQAYTKVPEFVKFAGKTGIMINTSLIAKGSGLDADGNLIFDDIEGMPYAVSQELRKMFPKTVGNILVGANTKHIIAAMASDDIDFIIPFHRSGLKKEQYDYLGLRGYTDYQQIQSEKVLDRETGKWRNAKTTEEKLLLPKLSDWWDYNKTGEQNAQAYLDLCDARGLKPAFVGQIGSVDDGTSEYVDLARDENGNVRKGYYKVLTDFKMYDHEGNAIRQEVVKADFDMDMLKSMMKDYDGSHTADNAAYDVVTDYVNEFKDAPPTTARMLQRDGKGSYSLKGESDILKENATLKEMNDYLRSQLKVTVDVTVDKKKTEAYAKGLLREYSSYLDKGQLVSDLTGLFNDMSRDAVDFDEIFDKARSISYKILDSASVVNNQLYTEYRDLIRRTREVPLKVNDLDKTEIQSIVGDYNEFRKKNFGTLKLVNDENESGITVDEYYSSLSETYPELFSEEIANQGEQLVRIADVIKSLQPFEENPHSEYMDEAVDFLAYDMMDQFFDIPQSRPTFADRQEKKLTQEKIKAAEKLRGVKEESASKLENERLKQAWNKAADIHELRKNQKARIETLKERNRIRTGEILQTERARRVEQITKLKEHYKTKEGKKSQSISDRNMRLRIQKLVKELSGKLLSPTDKQHVPDALRKPIAEFLKSIDFSTSRQMQGTRNKLASLQAAYLKIAAGLETGDADFYLDIDPDFIAMISELSETIGDKRVVDMNSGELMKLYQITRIVKATISNYNKILSDGLMQDVIFKGESVINDLLTDKPKNESGYELIRSLDTLVNFHMLAPADYFEQLGQNMNDLYGNIRKGLDKKIQNTKITTDYMNNLIDGADIKTWTGNKAKSTVFPLKNGKSIEMTPAQVMSLYLLSKREQARDHMYIGGIKHAPVTKKVKGKITVVKAFEPAKVTEADVANIISTLTPEQRKIADGISEFLNTYTSEWGNEVSMRLYGYKKFTEKNYFPIKSDDNYVISEFGTVNDPSLKGKGWTKATIRKANNPIIIDDIFDVFSKMADESSSYNAFVIPLSDIQKVMNYKGFLGSVKQFVEKKYGKEAIKYFSKLMIDINGGIRTDVGIDFISKLLSNYKASTMGLNPRVIIQQPTALIRASAMIDPKYLAMGIAKKGHWEDVTKNNPIAQWKSWGYFSMDIGRQMKDIFMGEKHKRDWFFKWIQDADNMAWSKLWNAVEYEIKDTRSDLTEGTPLFYEAVSRRFSEIVDRTQVVDTVLHRTQLMRSNDSLMKVYTSFMAEPMKSFNLLRTSIRKAVMTGSAEDKKKAVRTIIAWISTVAVNSVLVSLIDVYRNSDDDKTFLEKYRASLLGNALNDVTGMFPFVRDVASMANGFSPKRMELEGVNDALKATKKFGEYVAALWKGEQPNTTAAYILKDTASSFGKLFGLPISNVRREIETFTRNYIGWKDENELDYAICKVFYNINNSENRSRYTGILYKAVQDGQKDAAKRMYNDMLINGIPKDYINNSMNSHLRKTLDGTNEIKIMTEAVSKWESTPKAERTDAMKKEVKAEFDQNYKALLDAGYTDKDIQKAIKRNAVDAPAPTMPELLKAYDAAEKDESKQDAFIEMANRMIDAGYTEEEITAAIEAYKEK